jgi:ABC-type transport system substrate-binding protein
VAGQLTQAGIRTELKVYEWTTYMNKIAYPHGGGPMWLIGWGTPPGMPMTPTPRCSARAVLANYWNPEFNTLLDEAQTTMDSKKRSRSTSRWPRFWMEDLAGDLLYQQIDITGSTGS